MVQNIKGNEYEVNTQFLRTKRGVHRSTPHEKEIFNIEKTKAFSHLYKQCFESAGLTNQTLPQAVHNIPRE
jgi:hypothetical protein